MRISTRAGIAVLMVIGLAGCASASARPADARGPSIAAFVRSELSALPGVSSVDTSQVSKESGLVGECGIASASSSSTPSPSPRPTGPDCWDASLWRITVSVTMAETATADEASAAATAERQISEKFAVPDAKLWDAQFSLGRTIGGADTDTTPYSAGRFPVYPTVWKTPGESVRQVMAVLAVPGVVSVALGQAAPAVIAESPEHLESVYDLVQKSPALASANVATAPLQYIISQNTGGPALSGNFG
ncbi:hypothetical protein [Lacisediminihabitans changchengi]|uniref:Uncharacterized protein n=1 Tax=Lacisediminihabitans changchengi TaxID=2787634 RepID=A0A934SK28_9MICO|nr:hypothetical protein [Lacisediminihabitans changchengi]MBK4346362.1 hypothetical protein [Lacisediminihabitans changchengi]